MAISIDWPARIINVLKADMTLVQLTPIEVRELNMENFRLTLKDLEDEEDGQIWLDTHRHNAPVTVGGVTLAPVVEIINDYTVTFEDGAYLVNVFGANSNLADRVNPNNVSVRSANSAGLLQSREIEQAAFNNRISIDTLVGSPGTLYPRGTSLDPVDNLADAQLIDAVRGFKAFNVHGLLTIPTGADITDRYFYGGGLTLNESDAVITFEAGSIAEDTWYEGCVIQGVQGGESQYYRCRIQTLTNAHCHYDHCAMIGPVTAPLTVPTPGHTKSMINCFSGINEFVFDLNGSPLHQIWRAYMGDIRFMNGTDATAQIHINMAGGHVTIDASCTATEFYITGNCIVVNNSIGAVVNVDCVLPNNLSLVPSDTKLALIEKILRNKVVTDPITSKMYVYDDDGVTILLQGDLFENAAGTLPYANEGADRRERLV